jgi:glycosyltransferase involved in cell wall biosynthesis
MKVLIVGDAPYLKTGFGKINGIAAQAFTDKGWDVAATTGLSVGAPDNLPYTIFIPDANDVYGIRAAGEAIQRWEPDLVYHTGEPGTLTAFTKVIPARLPVVAYVPIEGEPIVSNDWKSVIAGLNVFTCSEYGAKIVKRDVGVDIDWVYHGIDHETFRVNGRRDQVRQMLGWSDKYVVITVAANVRRKQHPRLFEAIALLRHRYKQNDIILYDHTIPFNGYWLEGWHLPEVANAFHINDAVQFNPAMGTFNDAIPEVGQFDGLGLVDLYNAADLFVLPSQVEGFGLPIAEAMACGVPVMVTKYAAGWEVASPAGIGLSVKDWETHKSGTRYANTDVEAMAKEILRFRRNPREQVRRREAGLQRVRDFRWESFTEKLIATAEKAITEKAQEQSASGDRSQEPEDQNQVTSQEEGTGSNDRAEAPSENRVPSKEAYFAGSRS